MEEDELDRIFDPEQGESLREHAAEISPRSGRARSELARASLSVAAKASKPSPEGAKHGVTSSTCDAISSPGDQ